MRNENEIKFVKAQANNFLVSYKGEVFTDCVECDVFITSKTNGLSILGIEEITIGYPSFFPYGLPIKNYFNYSQNEFVNCLINLHENGQLKYLGIEDLFTSKNNYVCPLNIDYLFFHSEHADKIIVPILNYGYSNCVYAVFLKEIVLNSKLKENMKNVKYKPMWVNAYSEVIPDFV
jgi:hypothetical protein